MALNFPSSPTVGQVYDMYSWDGEKWVPLPSASGGGGISEAPTDGGLYGRKSAAWARGVALAGDTMSGNLGINKVDPNITLSKTSGGNYIIGGAPGGLRWIMQLGDSGAESGANAGSNFSLTSYNDAGAALATPIQIARANGTVTLSAGLKTNSDIIVTRNSGNTGAILFGNGTPYLFFDGTAFSFSGGNLALSTGVLQVYDGVNVLQFGGPSPRGIYTDTTNIAIRTPGANGTIYFQDAGSAKTYGLMNSGGLNVTGDFALSGNINMGAVLSLTGVGAQVATISYKDTAGTLRGYSTFDSASTGSFFLGINQTGGQQAYIRQDGYFILGGGLAAKPGGGSWVDSSDERIKTVVGDYGSGLAAIKQLQPVRYTYKGNDTHQAPSNTPLGALKQSESKDAPTVPYQNSPHYADAVAGTVFVGLVAQNTEGAMPECIKQIASYVDGQSVTDLRMLDPAPIMFALINAVKELSARVEQLEAAATP